MSALDLATRVLRAPLDLVSEDPDDLTRLAPGLVALCVGGIGLWAVVVGQYRGGLQLAYAPLKAPLLVLLPLAVCLPAIRAMFDREDGLSHTRVALAGLVGAARLGLLAGALAPVLWLMLSLDPGYHDAVLAVAGSLAVAGLPALWTILTSLRRPETSPVAMAVALSLLGGVTAQTGWLLRPFVVRPTAEIALFRPMESDVASSLGATSDAARDVYGGWDAKPAGVLGRGLHKEEGR
jgi:hypothetical protein